MIPGARLFVVEGGPHAVNWTHAAELNTELVEFLGKRAVRSATSEPGA
jgi:hypothetical protein